MRELGLREYKVLAYLKERGPVTIATLREELKPDMTVVTGLVFASGLVVANGPRDEDGAFIEEETLLSLANREEDEPLSQDEKAPAITPTTVPASKKPHRKRKALTEGQLQVRNARQLADRYSGRKTPRW